MFWEHVGLAGKLFSIERLNIEDLDPYPYHIHPEYELMHIRGASGKWFVGNRIEPFNDHASVIMGPNLPHKWQFDRISESNTIHVLKWQDMSQSELLKSHAGSELNSLWSDSRFGLRIEGIESLDQLDSAICKIEESNGFDQMIRFLEFMQLIAFMQKSKVCKPADVRHYKQEEVDRLDRVLNYLNNHYQDEIKLESLANSSHLSRSGFCTFFKKGTGKTFSSYLNELRIAHACRLIAETDMSTSQVAFESGYANLSYFNRQFLKIKGENPREFRKSIRLSFT